MRLGTTLLGAATAALLSGALVLVPVSAGADEHRSGPQLAPGPDGWRDGGRITGPRESILMDASPRGVVAAVGTDGITPQHPRAVSTVARRTPHGGWTRGTAHIGLPQAIDVAPDGDIVVVSTRGVDGGALIATRLPQGADRVRSTVIVSAADMPQYASAEVSANGRGDIAVLVTPYAQFGERALLLRKPSDSAWKPTLTIGAARYDGALDSVDVTPTGAVVGVFKQIQTLSVRTLPLGSAEFGQPTDVTTWAAIGDPSRLRKSYAAVHVGVNGDLATTWSYGVLPSDGGSELVTTRLNIVPAKGHPWQRQFERSDYDVTVAEVAYDGSVVIVDETSTRRWSPATRRLTGQGTAHVKDAHQRGDVLLGGGIYGGPLRLWPVGLPRGPEFEAPRGRLVEAALAADRVVYLAKTSATGQPFYLRFRRF